MPFFRTSSPTRSIFLTLTAAQMRLSRRGSDRSYSLTPPRGKEIASSPPSKLLLFLNAHLEECGVCIVNSLLITHYDNFLPISILFICFHTETRIGSRPISTLRKTHKQSTKSTIALSCLRLIACDYSVANLPQGSACTRCDAKKPAGACIMCKITEPYDRATYTQVRPLRVAQQ